MRCQDSLPDLTGVLQALKFLKISASILIGSCWPMVVCQHLRSSSRSQDCECGHLQGLRR